MEMQATLPTTENELFSQVQKCCQEFVLAGPANRVPSPLLLPLGSDFLFFPRMFYKITLRFRLTQFGLFLL